MTWPIFVKTFFFIFAASLPGRTTFVMLLLPARGRPLGIFLGAAAAFACQSLISVALGEVLAFFPQVWIHAGAGLLFIFFAFLFWRSATEKEEKISEAAHIKRSSLFNAAKISFLMIFAAEWGDISQIAIASVTAQSINRWSVLLGSVLALWTIAAIAVTAGSYAQKWISRFFIQRAASGAFAAIGIYMVASSLVSILK